MDEHEHAELLQEGTGEPTSVDEARPTRPRRPPRPRTRRPLVWLLRLLLLAVIFLAGLVIGKAVEDGPEPGGEQTIVNTLRVSTVGPVETVTVTVSGQ